MSRTIRIDSFSPDWFEYYARAQEGVSLRFGAPNEATNERLRLYSAKNELVKLRTALESRKHLREQYIELAKRAGVDAVEYWNQTVKLVGKRQNGGGNPFLPFTWNGIERSEAWLAEMMYMLTNMEAKQLQLRGCELHITPNSVANVAPISVERYYYEGIQVPAQARHTVVSRSVIEEENSDRQQLRRLEESASIPVNRDKVQQDAVEKLIGQLPKARTIPLDNRPQAQTASSQSAQTIVCAQCGQERSEYEDKCPKCGSFEFSD